MTLREALVNAVDYIRSSGTEDPMLIQTARALGRRAEVIRARTEEPAAWVHWCDCGERKRKSDNFCVACYRAFPVAMVAAWLTGRRELSARAWRQMKAISETRVQAEALRNAA